MLVTNQPTDQPTDHTWIVCISASAVWGLRHSVTCTKRKFLCTQSTEVARLINISRPSGSVHCQHQGHWSCVWRWCSESSATRGQAPFSHLSDLSFGSCDRRPSSLRTGTLPCTTQRSLLSIVLIVPDTFQFQFNSNLVAREPDSKW